MSVKLITMDHLRALEARGFWEWMVARGAPDECWPWTRAVAKNGYGHAHVKVPEAKNGDVSTHAHRVAWSLHNGRLLAPGAEIDHTCRVRACCNPAHLDEVTHTLNIRRIPGVQVPRKVTNKDGTEVWVIRYYDYSEGRRRYRGMTFDTYEDALAEAEAIKERRAMLAADERKTA